MEYINQRIQALRLVTENRVNNLLTFSFQDKKVYIERDVGDSQAVDSHNCKPANFEMSESSNFCGMEALQIFVKKKGHDTKNSIPSDRNVSSSLPRSVLGVASSYNILFP